MINYFLIFISFFHYLILLFFYEKKIPIHVIESKLGLFFDRNVVFSDTTTIKKNRSRNSNVKNNNITKTINIMFMLPLLIMDSTNKNHELLSERALSFYLGSKYASDFFLSKKQKIKFLIQKMKKIE
ncbi:hypothetical protein [Blattabacterium cuenoti]|uniref:hypothetical protein n=1 Tax=Blattabacterium cuenoti TaxID=1653831 RepID=UPI001EEA9C0B|nr:hypothetical protein [Blattabacterium cuenoti]